MDNWFVQEGPEQDIVVSSRIRLARNFRQLPFPSQADKKAQQQVIELAEEGAAASGIANMRFVAMKDLPELDKEYLVETHSISQDLARSKRNCGLLVGESPVSVMVNEEDHLRIQSILPGLQLQKACEECLKYERVPVLQKNYAFTYEFGYLTACPTNTGTALRASAMVHVPALVISGKINSVLDSCSKLGIAVRGIYGENSGSGAYMLQISNQVTLGQSEQEIIVSINNIIEQICMLERKARTMLLESKGIYFTDRIYRALGILKNARTIDSEEAMKLLSEVKMGIDMGILQGASKSQLVTMMTNVQPACLQKLQGRILSSEERDQERAASIRECIRDIE